MLARVSLLYALETANRTQGPTGKSHTEHRNATQRNSVQRTIWLASIRLDSNQLDSIGFDSMAASFIMQDHF